MSLLNMNVNGKECAVEVEPHEYLAYVLREKLGLTGTKIGCDEAECGACTVLVDGTAVDSCLYPALKAQGARVETVEGLTRAAAGPEPALSDLHPLQRSFVEHGAVQCGFCTPGLLMAAKGLLDKNPSPTDADIKVALKDNYCRCTGYVSVLNAIKSAASQIRASGTAAAAANAPDLPSTKAPLAAVGQPLPRN
ncbi:MAG: (2Fe-2S)-binding protein, partial [Chloroflexi bacterium]|nr:(2Fe-2S)-binding protein [Chloroflexota bacterium]